jgi:hypothetical protein
MKTMNRDILLVAPKYYGYEDVISAALVKGGDNVTFIENKAFQYDPINRGTKWFTTFLCLKNRYIRTTLIPVSQKKFDVCFFINLFSFDPAIIKNLRLSNPSIRCVLYLWDNIRGYKWQQFFSYFDEIYCFDPVESEQFNLKYLPNFYPDIQPALSSEFDLCSIASLQVHRLKKLTQIVQSAEKSNSKFFFYLYLPRQHSRLKYNWAVYQATKLFPNRFTGYKYMYGLISRSIENELVKHDPISLSNAIDVMGRSKCIVDLPYPWQTGSTQRVINALALNKKVITSNESAVKESFYDPEFIKVVPLSEFSIDWNWINRKTETSLDLSSLRIDNWLKRLLS